MITPELRWLLDRRKELEDLFRQTSYVAPGRDGIKQVVHLAQRALAIIQQWPEDAWPLEDAEDVWPDREPLMELLHDAIAEANAYRGNYALADYSEWSKPRMDVYAALYYFRDKAMDKAHEE